MEQKVIFDYMCEDEVKSHIEIDCAARQVSVANYTDVIYDQALGKMPPTIESVQTFLKGRCFEEKRADKNELLGQIGLKQYNPLDIVRQTKGRMWGDHFWIRFAGDPTTWADFK